MTPNERAIAEVYAATFAARQDDWVYWTGDTWVRRGEPLTAEVIAAAFSGGSSVSGYTVAPDGRSLVIKRNAPGENDEVEIYFVIEEAGLDGSVRD